MSSDKKPRVALIFGGRGYEREVSVRGAENLFSLIPNEKYEKILIFIDREGRFLMPRRQSAGQEKAAAKDGRQTPSLTDGEAGSKEISPARLASGEADALEVYPACVLGRGGFLTEGEFLPIDAAFPLLHGNFGEDGIVQGALECAKIAYVGCDTLGSAMARDKALVGAVAERLSIPTPRFLLCKKEDISEAVSESEKLFGYPVFIKPTALGSSFGAGVAKSREELILMLGKALSLSQRAMIQEYIDIEKELECAYFVKKGKELFTNLGEIRADGFYDYEKKYGRGESRDSKSEIRKEENEGTAKVRDFSDVGEEIEGAAREYARRLVRMLSLRDLSRIDFFLSKDGRLYFNEINTMPGFTDSSLYMRLIARCGVSPSQLVCSLIDGAIARGV